MYNIINWICFVSIVFLVSEMMMYFCKDALNIYDISIKSKSKTVENTRCYTYDEKIAK